MITSPSGVELACELAIWNSDKAVTLMEKGTGLLPRACPATQATVVSYLKDNKVHLMLNKESNVVGKVIFIFFRSKFFKLITYK